MPRKGKPPFVTPVTTYVTEAMVDEIDAIAHQEQQSRAGVLRSMLARELAARTRGELGHAAAVEGKPSLRRVAKTKAAL